MDRVPRGRAGRPHCHLQTGQGAWVGKSGPQGGVVTNKEEVTDKKNTTGEQGKRAWVYFFLFKKKT